MYSSFVGQFRKIVRRRASTVLYCTWLDWEYFCNPLLHVFQSGEIGTWEAYYCIILLFSVCVSWIEWNVYFLWFFSWWSFFGLRELSISCHLRINLTLLEWSARQQCSKIHLSEIAAVALPCVSLLCRWRLDYKKNENFGWTCSSLVRELFHLLGMGIACNIKLLSAGLCSVPALNYY